MPAHDDDLAPARREDADAAQAGKGYFHIGSSGHEASQTALGRAFTGGHDAFCFYYRDLATALSVGMTVEEILRAHFGKAGDPNGGGRQMPEHFGHKDLNILSTSSSVGAQYLPAVGFALAHKRDAAAAERAGEPALDTPSAVYVSGGEGSTSQGAFHEGLNWAARESLPVVFHVQDNGYAISVPVREQTAGGSIWTMLGGYPGLSRLKLRRHGPPREPRRSQGGARARPRRPWPRRPPRRRRAPAAALVVGRPQQVPRGRVGRGGPRCGTRSRPSSRASSTPA